MSDTESFAGLDSGDYVNAKDKIQRALMNRELYGLDELVDPMTGDEVAEEVVAEDELVWVTHSVGGISITQCIEMQPDQQ